MRRAFGYAVVFALALASAGCQKIFTTTLAPDLVRTSITIPATISNTEASALISSSDTSTAALTSLLTVLNEQVTAGDATPETKALAVEAALGASDVASTVTTPILAAATTVASGGTVTSATITSIVSALQDATSTTGVSTAMGRLSDPAVLTAAAADMSSTQLVITALVVAAAALPTGVTDPTAMTDAQKDTYQGSAEITLAKEIVAAAVTKMAEEGGDEGLINTLSAYLNMG